MARYAAEGEAACAKAIAALPGLAEPHARLARILDAAHRPQRAAEEADLALALDADHAPALVLRVTLSARRFSERVHEQLVIDLHARSGQLSGGVAGATLKRVWWMDAVGVDPEAARLRARIEADAGRLEAKTDSVPPGEFVCVRAFVAWARTELELAQALLEQAAAAGVVEAFDALAKITAGRGRYDEADAWLSKAIAQNPGFAALHARRAENRYDWAQVKRRASEDVRELVASAVAGLTDALRLDPTDDDAHLTRAIARTLVVMDEAAYRASLEDVEPDAL
jgi:tetratricopeptide (TPR) repeat protein